MLKDLIREESSSSSKSGRSQLVDLVVADKEADETERVRARKEGGSAWNENEVKHYVRAYDDEDEGEDIRHGFDPSEIPPAGASNFAIEDDEEDEGASEEQTSQSSDAQMWAQQKASDDGSGDDASRKPYEDLDDGHVWKSKDRDEHEE